MIGRYPGAIHNIEPVVVVFSRASGVTSMMGYRICSSAAPILVIIRLMVEGSVQLMCLCMGVP